MAEATDPQPLPYVPLQPFNNGSIATGGDSLLYDLNVFYNVRPLQLQRKARVTPPIPVADCGDRRAISRG